MSRWKRHLFTVSLLVAAVSLGAAQNQADEEAIRSLGVQWQEMFNQGEFEELSNLYTQNARFSGISGDVADGRDQIIALLEEPLPFGEAELNITSEEVEVAGDMAHGWGGFTFTTPDGAEAVTGNYLIVLRQVDGEWRIHRHIANVVMPREEQASAGGEG